MNKKKMTMIRKLGVWVETLVSLYGIPCNLPAPLNNRKFQIFATFFLYFNVAKPVLIGLLMVLFLYNQKKEITIKKLLNLTIVVLLAPIFLNGIIFIMPYLIEILPFFFLEYNTLVYRIEVWFFSIMYKYLLIICSKKGFIDILTNICILYVIRLVFLGLLFILDGISNAYFTNSLFSSTLNFYSITLTKVVAPYVENIYTTIMNRVTPYFWFLDNIIDIWSVVTNCMGDIFYAIIKFTFHFEVIHCSSPEGVTEQWKRLRLPYHGEEDRVLVSECKTNHYKYSKVHSRNAYEEYRRNMSVFTPDLTVFMKSNGGIVTGEGHETMRNEPSKGQLDKGKKRALSVDSTEMPNNKIAKLVHILPERNLVTNDDYDSVNDKWNVEKVYLKMQNVIEDPNYDWKWDLNTMFVSEELHKKFYWYLEHRGLIKNHLNVIIPRLMLLHGNIYKDISHGYQHVNSIKPWDFWQNSINYSYIKPKLENAMNYNIIARVTNTVFLDKLIFEPPSLRKQFYYALSKDGYLFKNDNPRDVTIHRLYNYIYNRDSFNKDKLTSISWDDFDLAYGRLNLKSIHYKIKLSLEKGIHKETDTISRLFSRNSLISERFYTYLMELYLTQSTHINTVKLNKIQSLMNNLEIVLDPFYIPKSINCINYEDLNYFTQLWDMHSVHRKTLDIIRGNNLGSIKVWEMEYGTPVIRKEFYKKVAALNNVSIDKARYIDIIDLKNNLEIQFNLAKDTSNIE